MKLLAPDLWRLKELPAPSINIYLAEDVLIDAGRRWDRRRIFAETKGREISMLALTHAHPDHQGVAKDFCEARRIPLACHADDVDAMEGRRPMQEAAINHPVNRVIKGIWQGPPYRVERVLGEGEEVAGFRVIHAPGHARGEVIFFRESDRVAICGDVIRNMSYASGRPMIGEPPKIFTYDPAENRRSIRKLAELNPSLILPGHGPTVTDMAEFERFVATLAG
ncbi:MAG TPA: MBL fold metallo-hydrolase [Solirubrobacterales bacterium]|jgi:glyoxylase-like metal-dependent hydrolase (beta-lactamase superfamily II)|nr:MBL fold metallo-hydrolase [Solirubrobacterales bacterium]